MNPTSVGAFRTVLDYSGDERPDLPDAAGAHRASVHKYLALRGGEARPPRTGRASLARVRASANALRGGDSRPPRRGRGSALRFGIANAGVYAGLYAGMVASSGDFAPGKYQRVLREGIAD